MGLEQRFVRVGRTLWSLSLNFRQSEVENLDAIFAGDEDVGRFDVAMEDTFGVRRLEAVYDLMPLDQSACQVPEVCYESSRPETCAVQELHGHEDAAILFTDVVDGADVGMVERRSGACLALESLAQLPVVGVRFRQELQRDERPRRVSWALYTTPMPPAPSFSRMR